ELLTPPDERVPEGHHLRSIAPRGQVSVPRLGTSTDPAVRMVRQPNGMDLNNAVQRLFTPARHPGRIRGEGQLLPVTHTAHPQPVDPASLAVGLDAGFMRAAVPTFEPGGQLELSPPPRASVAALVRDVAGLIGRAGAIAAARGVRLEALGTNPYHS